MWREWGLKPWRTESFKFSTDPQPEAKVRDVTGFYLNPPDKAVVLCVDEKPQTQALERKAPVLPTRPGIPEKRSHDYIRHGTTAPLRRAGGRHRQGDRRRPSPSTGTRRNSCMFSLTPGREGLSRAASCTSSCDNYGTAHPPGRTRLAGQAPPDHAALHANVRVVAESRGRSSCIDHPAGHLLWQLHLGPRPHHCHRDLLSTAESPLPSLHLDQDRRREIPVLPPR